MSTDRMNSNEISLNDSELHGHIFNYVSDL